MTELASLFVPCSLPISESSDSLSPDVVMPTAPATELEAIRERNEYYVTQYTYMLPLHKILLGSSRRKPLTTPVGIGMSIPKKLVYF